MFEPSPDTSAHSPEDLASSWVEERSSGPQGRLTAAEAARLRHPTQPALRENETVVRFAVPGNIGAQQDRWHSALRRCRTGDGKLGLDAFSSVMALLEGVSIRFTSPIETLQDLTGFVNTVFSVDGQLSLIPVAGEGFKGESGFAVLLVIRPDGSRMAVLKLFRGSVEHFVAEISSLQRIAELRPNLVVHPLAVARGECPGTEPFGVLVMSVAPGRPLDDLLFDLRDGKAGAGERMQMVLARLGATLGDLHGCAPSTEAPLFPVGMHAVAATRIVERCRPYTRLLQEQFAFDLAAISGRMQDLVEAYLRDPGPRGLIHGQANPGNFFWDEQDGLTMVDVSMFHLSMGLDGTGFGVCARDIGHFMRSFEKIAHTQRLSAGERLACRNAFLSGYQQVRELPPPHAIDFFMMRTTLGLILESMARPTFDLTDLELRRLLKLHFDSLESVSGGVR